VAPLISVIIPSRAGEAVIGACLEALAAQTLKADRVIVVDDASTDGSAALVREKYSWVRLIELKESRGYAGACAAGYEEAQGDWIAVLNNDAVPDPGWLEAAVKAAESDGVVGSVACLVVLAEPEGAVDSVGLIAERSGLARLSGRGRKEEELENTKAPVEVFGPAGSAVVYRRAALDEVGFFEPDFETYYEDVDLAWRLRWAGWKCLLAHESRVVHRHSYTMDRINVEKRRLLQRNRIRAMVRNWPASWLALYCPIVMAYDLGSVAVAAREGALGQAFRARVDVMRALSSDLVVRRRTLGRAKADPEEMRKWLGRR